ncbi:MAG: amylo-alpha-1,6-glucosidase [Bryobacteraceae bacterium]
MIRFDQAVCGNLEVALRREWLETNGLGGFASSTITGLNTRRYHGLLVAATRPPVGRMVLLSKIEETLLIGARRYDLSANQYPGVVYPDGYRYLREFRQDPFPTFVYRVQEVEIEKSVFLVHGENTAVIHYELRSATRSDPPACMLELRPLIAFRDYHGTTHENGALDSRLEIGPSFVKVAPYPGVPPLYLNHSGAEVQPAGFWYRNFEYQVERERGLDFIEDLFNPMVLVFDLDRTPHADILASTEARSAATGAGLRQAEIARRVCIAESAPPGQALVPMLVQAADQFLVKRGEGHTIIAGYPWFSDWGRDTMIALPGLTLTTGRYDVARSILLEFAAHVDRGMLPNRFPDAGETPEYNTVDATLWFFEAVRAWVATAGERAFVRENLYPVLTDIISWHERGTRYGIHADDDGLLSAGEPGLQLTWMDARVGDRVITPRRGKPVEIQALWYNSLRVMEELARGFDHLNDAAHYAEIAARAADAFPRLFWNESASCLYDVVNGDNRDASIRPNQIFAVSLFHKMLPGGQARAVVEAVRRHLFTPYGMRTLAPCDPQYRGRFEGSPASRDSAYHQGTVWPWLMGPFISAYVDVNGRTDDARRQAGKWLEPFRRYMEGEGVGQLPEVFDGDAPQRPGGCIAQAWSVAELLRAAVQDVYQPATRAG